ncbi:MAG: hypothetical protein H7839_19395, partial [Magnetococcus sp. YQC-5]
MVERCPGCGAKGPGSEVCRRCGAELQVLTRIVHDADWVARQIVVSLTRGDLEQALDWCEQVMRLRQTSGMRDLVGFVLWMHCQHQRRQG